MNRLIRHRPSPAMVVACLALLVALGGTSVAAVQALAPNSVGTAQLRANAVTAAKIKNRNVTGAKLALNAVTGATVRNRSLSAADFIASSLPVGPQGPAGAAGPAGPAGPAGTIGPISVRQASVTVPGGVAQNSAYDTETVSVNCNANEKAISAGTGWSDDALDRELWTQRLTPVLTGTNVTGFRATGGNDSGNTSTFTLFVLCYVG
ncbi:MAG: hypothetical protein H0W16_04210 [Actinobacteria bacterium]|nr:hypothetical protein [Actinomycetota bacterium]